MGFGGRQALSGRQEKGFWNSSALCNLCHSTSGARDFELVVAGWGLLCKDCHGVQVLGPTAQPGTLTSAGVY